jgi:hypothetical protein
VLIFEGFWGADAVGGGGVGVTKKGIGRSLKRGEAYLSWGGGGRLPTRVVRNSL